MSGFASDQVSAATPDTPAPAPASEPSPPVVLGRLQRFFETRRVEDLDGVFSASMASRAAELRATLTELARHHRCGPPLQVDADRWQMDLEGAGGAVTRALRCRLDPDDDTVAEIDQREAHAGDEEIDVHATDNLDPETVDALHRLFDVAYANADHGYLTASLRVLRYVATATHGGAVVGFALGETRVVNLPRLPRQTVALAGLACVDPNARRRGLFRRLSGRPLMFERRAANAELVLVAGRMAHPASMRALAGAPGWLPRRHHEPDEWQRQVATAVARLYGVEDFDPYAMVCRGRGRPMGRPVIDLDVEDQEWEPFESVDRDRGDALLAIAWLPRPPLGWT